MAGVVTQPSKQSSLRQLERDVLAWLGVFSHFPFQPWSDFFSDLSNGHVELFPLFKNRGHSD